jgi:hypothetical protein
MFYIGKILTYQCIHPGSDCSWHKEKSQLWLVHLHYLCGEWASKMATKTKTKTKKCIHPILQMLRSIDPPVTTGTIFFDRFAPNFEFRKKWKTAIGNSIRNIVACRLLIQNAISSFRIVLSINNEYVSKIKKYIFFQDREAILRSRINYINVKAVKFYNTTNSLVCFLSFENTLA